MGTTASDDMMATTVGSDRLALLNLLPWSCTYAVLASSRCSYLQEEGGWRWGRVVHQHQI
jgi:hypothetical protein